MSKKTIEEIERLLAGIIASMGYELADITFEKEYSDWVLTLYLDREGGITIDDCERVSRAVDPILDEADPIPQAYCLSVSSLGLDRPLKKEKDFQRNIGKLLTVKLYVPMERKKEFVGTLQAFDGESFVLKLKDGEEKTFLRKNVALIKPYIEF